MKKITLLFLALVFFSSHDMFLKLDGYFLKPNSAMTVRLMNGTFDRSDNVIDRDRMIDVSLVENGKRTTLDTSQWREEATTTLLNLTTREPGTYLVGVSTRARNIEMSAEDFNNYLDHDGVLDMLGYRRENDLLDQDAVEKYSKHVKTLFQVGNKKTDDWQTVLGYPIEFVPLKNPYQLHVNDEMEVQLLWQGEPLANQLVYVGTKPSAHSHSHDEHSHDHDHGHEHTHDHDDHDHARDAGHSHDHDDGHAHAEGGDHDHDHGHSHDDEHTHDHDSGHSHDHDDDHAHAHGDDHDHDHDHGHSHDDEHSHDHDSGHSHDHDDAHAHEANHSHDDEQAHTHSEVQYRTDANGNITIPMTNGGTWYMKTIHLVESEEDGLTHESNWATLTFALGHDHSHDGEHSHEDGHAHDHDHDEAGGLPGYVYWGGSLLLVGLLFVFFSGRKQ